MVNRRTWTTICGLLVVALGAIVLLWPVLFSPITADDRYWYIDTPARSDLSYAETVRITVREIPRWLELGRFTPLASLARRMMILATFDFSVATSTSLVTSQGIAKLILAVTGLASCLAFLRSLRWRVEDRLIRVDARRTTAIGVALIALVAAGAQAHTQFRNSWISYPVLTYGAVTVVFGSAALAAWLTRRATERRRGSLPLGIAAMLILGFVLNVSYELYYIAFVLCLAVLLIFPYSAARGNPDSRRARAWIGGSLALSFITVFVGLRSLMASACLAGDCYIGAELSLGGQVPITFWRNFFSSVPGLSHDRFLADLQELGASSSWTSNSTSRLFPLAVLIGIAVLAVWKSTTPRMEAADAESVAQRRLLFVAAALSLGVALGGALIMSLSVQAQDVIPSVGYPYRHTVLTWTACALFLVTLAMAGNMTVSKVGRIVPIALVLIVVVATAFSFPRNLASNQAYRNAPSNRAIADIHWEAVAGDRSDLGDERRCQSLERAEAAIQNPWLKRTLEPALDEVFRRLNGMPYCSEWKEAAAARTQSSVLG